MPADTPITIGPYRIVRELGRGGMGIVYLAHDTRLDRRVAIKALPDAVAADPERMARFEREARVLASLNHPNLAAVYDVLDVEGRRYLAMEYVDGESLADRLRRDGALPLSDTLEIGAQICAGMDAAHEGGVVHRDLKPANVMITPGEGVKVVDFGLAKGRVWGEESVPRGHAVSPVLSSSPTLDLPGTMPGVILGTAGYLSPEQARGKVVDRRTDIWSFGCILYECLTGKKLFEGETVADTIAAVLERPLQWSALPKSTPPGVRELLERCLERDPRKRLRDIGEARLVLEEARSSAGAAGAAGAAASAKPAPPLWRRVMPILGAVGALVLGWHLFGASILSSLRGPAPPIRRLSVAIPASLEADQWTLTPDGSTLLLRARPRTPRGEAVADYRIFRRKLDEDEFRPIPGTDRVEGFAISPDGKSMYFLSTSPQGPDQLLSRVPIDGSIPAASIAPWGPGWGPGVVLESGDMILSAGGTNWTRLRPDGTTTPSSPSGVSASDIFFVKALPRDRGVLFLLTSYSGGEYQAGIGVLDLRSGKSKVLLPDAGSPLWDGSGRLLFTRGGTLLAAPFDLGRLEVSGTPVALVDRLHVPQAGSHAQVAFSRDGTLAYRSGSTAATARKLVAVARGGLVTEWSSAERSYERYPRLSPDGARVACTVTSSRGTFEAWVVARGRSAGQRVSPASASDCVAPIWSPDGSRIAYGVLSNIQRTGIYEVSSAGGGPARFLGGLPQSSWRALPTSWSPDRSTILISMGAPSDMGALPVQASPAEPRPLSTGPASEVDAYFSPDGRWVVHISNESGREEAYVRPFLPGPALGPPTQLSTAGARFARWGRDGANVFYETSDGRILRTPVRTRPNLQIAPPTPVWDLTALRILSMGWDLTPDGSLLGIQKSKEEDELSRVDVVLGFDRELKMKLARTR